MSKNVIRFVKYLHSDSSTDEEVEHLMHGVRNGDVEIPSDMSEEDLEKLLEEIFETQRPWYEIGLIMDLDLNTKEFSYVGVQGG